MTLILKRVLHAIACLCLTLAPAAAGTNVLFIAVDDLKPALGCYGDANAITPHIDALARSSTVFLNAQCQWPVCGPSRASLMTGLRPEAVGVMDLKTDMRAKNPDVLTLPQHFRNHGYTTAGVGKIYDPRCVDNKHDLDKPSWSIPFTRLNYGKIKHNEVKDAYQMVDVEDAALADGQIARDGIKLMRRLKKETAPFFLAVGFKKPHLPFVAPRKYGALYKDKPLQFPTHTAGIKNGSGYTLHDSPEFRGYGLVPERGPIPAEVRDASFRAYLACVSFIDAQVGLLMEELKKLKLDENTIVVLWGDHGFHLGDHGMWGKHSTLQHSARSPLLIRPASGTRIAKTRSPAEFTDIFPTLCSLAKLPVPTHLNGHSLEPVIRKQQDQVRDGALTVFKKRGALVYSFRTEQHRYTEYINKFGKVVAVDLFDYEADPLEKVNLAGQPGQEPLMKMLAAALRREAAGCERLQNSK